MNLKLNLDKLLEKDEPIADLQDAIYKLYTKEQQEYIFDNFDNFYNDVSELIIDALNKYIKT